MKFNFLLALALALVPACDHGSSGGGATAQTPTVPIHVLALDETGVAPAGALVLVNGKQAGVLAADGSATVEGPVPADVVIEVLVPHLSGGKATLSTSLAGLNAVSLITEGKGCARDASLARADGRALFIPAENEFRLQLLDPAGHSLDLAEMQFVLASPVTSGDGNLTSLFQLEGGDLILNDAAALTTVLGSAPGERRLLLSGVDSSGLDIEEAFSFRIGAGSLTGVITSPPSQPGLAVSGLSVLMHLIDFSPSSNSYDFVTTSDASGAFSVAGLPKGSYELECHTSFAGVIYSATGTVFISSSPVSLEVTLCSTQDLLNGVVPITLASPLQAAAPLGMISPERLDPRQTPRASPFLFAAATGSGSASVTATTGNQDVPGIDIASMTMPAGTTQLTLRYEVCTEEYPNFVIPQSQFNDNWQVQVFDATGQGLFNISRNVNSQLFIDPIWQPNGCTGLQVEVISLGVTLAADTQVSLRASATNIGDSALQTTVTAEIGVALDFDVTKVTVATGTDLYSQPRNAQSNVTQRAFQVEFTKPESVSLKHVRVELCGSDNQVPLTTILDEDFPSASGAVTDLDDDSLKVRVTYGGGLVSSLASDPPPKRDVIYRVSLTAQIDGTDVTKSRFSTQRRAFWRMPPAIPRYGARDVGLDDWCSLGTYQWLSSNGGLVTRVDDISGEHGKDLGHATHRRGTDVDMFQFTTLDATSGTNNYQALLDQVLLAAGGDAPALAVVTSWFTDQRAGLAALLVRADVERMFGALGTASGSVPVGWYRDLLRNGRIPATGVALVDTGLGAWSPTGLSKLTHNHVHNSHYHIDLAESQIGD